MRKAREKLDFEELHQGLLPKQAATEAARCLYCYDAPCKNGCPAGIDVPSFIQSIKTNNLKRAARLINDENPLGSVCGRVCPVERLCEANCTAKKLHGKSIAIGKLQAYACDSYDYKRPSVEKNGRKVAVIGSGPSGLACAAELARCGHQVTIFESKNIAGGMIAFGVPEYRCSHKITAKEVEKIKSEGIEIRTATPVNQDTDRLFELGYEAVYVAVGLTKTIKPDIPGLELKGVQMGLDFLTRISTGANIPEIGKKIIVVGGGDTALDCARSALRLGAEDVTIIYRRSFTELPATKAEIEEALSEGIVFRTLVQPAALLGDSEGILRAVEAVNIKLGLADESGRRSPVEVKDSNFRLPCNTIIFATGTEPPGLLKKLLPGIDYRNDKFPAVDPETFETALPGVFCGGDAQNGGATVVQAVAEGKAAAKGIMKYLAENRVRPPKMEHQADAVVFSRDALKSSVDIIYVPSENSSAPSSADTGSRDAFRIVDAKKVSDSNGARDTSSDRRILGSRKTAETESEKEEIKNKWKEKLLQKNLIKSNEGSSNDGVLSANAEGLPVLKVEEKPEPDYEPVIITAPESGELPAFPDFQEDEETSGADEAEGSGSFSGSASKQPGRSKKSRDKKRKKR